MALLFKNESTGNENIFIHIPKCAGLWIRQVIQGEIDSEKMELHPFHGIPPEITSNMRIFATVRHPASWLQSFWAFRNNISWKTRENPDPYWPSIVGMTQVYKNNNFETFVNNILIHKPELVSTIYKLYHHSFIKYYKLESELPKLINDLGLDFEKVSDKYPPKNVTHNKPKLTSEIIRHIEMNETWAMEIFGY